MHYYYHYILLGLAALVAGYIDAIAGGGGLLTIPALLNFGIAPHLALGTNKLNATLGVCNASYIYIKQGLFDYRQWLAATVAAAIGAVIGTCLVHLINTIILYRLLPLLTISLAIYYLFNKKPHASHTNKQCNTNKSKCIVAGLVIGSYDGFFGPGTGAYWYAVALNRFNLPTLQAAALARFMNSTSNIAALLVFIFFGNLDYRIGLGMGLCQMLGANFGAKSAIRFGGNFIHIIFLCIVIAISIKLCYEYW